jgi:hypothetical protein
MVISRMSLLIRSTATGTGFQASIRCWKNHKNLFVNSVRGSLSFIHYTNKTRIIMIQVRCSTSFAFNPIRAMQYSYNNDTSS